MNMWIINNDITLVTLVKKDKTLGIDLCKKQQQLISNVYQFGLQE